MDVLDLIASDNYITFNKTLAKEIGLEQALLYGALCGYHRYYKGEEFFKEQEQLMEDTCLSEYLIRNATKKLCELGLISVEKKGLPAKNYYKLNLESLIKLLSTSGIKFDTTRNLKNSTSINNSNSININNKKNNNKKEENSLLLKFFEDNGVIEYINNWIEFKKEKRQTYKETGLNTLLKQLKKDFTDKGKNFLIKKIEWSIANNYSGIYAPPNYKKPTNTAKTSPIKRDSGYLDSDGAWKI